MPTKTIQFQAVGNTLTNGRTFQIQIESLPNGTAQVVELLSGGGTAKMDLPGVLPTEIAATSFFGMRLHYRKLFTSDLMAAIRTGQVVKLPPDAAPSIYSIGANMRGWPDGYPKPVEDNMSDWIDAV